MGERIGVSDEEWALIGPLLPPERGRGCRPAQDNRRLFRRHDVDGPDGLAVAASFRTSMASGTASSGAIDAGSRPACSMPCSRRWPRWQDVRPAADMIDSTVVRAHHCAVGLKRGLNETEGLGRSRGGFTTKLHARCDARGRPLGFVLTPGQAHDVKGFAPLFRMIDDGSKRSSPIVATMPMPSAKRSPLQASKR